ncbi:PREDICTED: UDP-glycosyltransferase 92A1-like isoform X2 [Ipomoea nil]|uniref:UDP-glycosyltransferase 92A1-like isoform X2 n=1 Tax=Ipomoea nil TaxID=35883 RepID=UPI000901D9EA|nr:PREDICTED: UDP-glycosyltransferase 92A1-like isoform X2 [Ipomoea nil]
MGGSECAEHIVMLPFMAHGHMIPFLGLAKQIKQTTAFKLTIVTTPLNVQYLTSCIDDPEIRLAALPFTGADHGLPPGVENTEALPLRYMFTMVQSTVALKDPLRNFISDMAAKDRKPPLCIISDVFMGWASEVARSCGTVNVGFSTSGAYGTACYMSIWRDLPHLAASDYGEFTVPAFPDSCRFNVSKLHPFMRAANGEDSWSKVFRSTISGCFESIGWLCNTVKEIEPLGSDALGKCINLPVWCIGPFLPPGMLNKGSSSITGKRTGKDHGLSPEKCIEWLDMHSEGSVLYISFGSQNTISASQMMALALGLEDSRKPFIWVIRPPIGFDIKGEFKSEWLPEGFTERKQGLLIHSWAPQLEILCHKSTGAFLSHCGWNSSIESLSQGVPMIGWPMAGEQAFNSKMMMEEMGVCIELTNGVQSTILRSDVKSVIGVVLDSEKGREMKENAVRIGELIRAAVREDETSKGSSLQAMDHFISTLRALQKN